MSAVKLLTQNVKKVAESSQLLISSHGDLFISSPSLGLTGTYIKFTVEQLSRTRETDSYIFIELVPSDAVNTEGLQR